MIKRFTYLLFLSLIIFNSLLSQPYANSWINFGQQYYKFSVTTEGIYRIDKTTLTNAGINVSGIVPGNMHLYCKGIEQYVYINDESPMGVFGNNDFIEFYATKNDGSLDIEMYKTPDAQTNPYYSLITDTNTYFLTWNNTANTKLYIQETDLDFATYSPALDYCIKPVLTMETNTNTGGAETNGSYYTYGEGWYGGDGPYFSPFGLNTSGTITTKSKIINTPYLYPTGPDTKIKMGLVSASGLNHHLSISFLSQSFDTIFYGYRSIVKNFSSSSSLLGSNISFNFTIINDISAVTDYHRLSYVLVEYPHTYNFEGSNKFNFKVPNGTGSKAYISISNFSGGTNPVLYDLTNHKRIMVKEQSGIYHALVPNSTAEKTCYIVSENSIGSVSDLRSVSFTNYLTTDFNSDYIIITHSSLSNEADIYKAYRNSTGYNVLVADIEDLYNQFSYGVRKHPIAIKNFAEYLLGEYDSVPKNLLLLGKGIHSFTCRKYPSYNPYNLVPTFGNPGSDNLLTSGLNGSINEPAIPTGRIAATNANEVAIYLQKVMEYEGNEPDDWMKEVLHFGGGNTSNQQAQFAQYLSQYEDIIEDTLFGGNVSSFYKTSSAPIQISQAEEVRLRINSGVSLMTFFGHGYSGGFDVGIDDVQLFENRFKYPLVIANSCLTGDIHQPSKGISEEWILIQNKGAIGFLATVDQSFDNILHDYSKELYKNISYKTYGKPIASCIQNTIKYLQPTLNSSNYISTYEAFTLHGDPAVIINSQALPDLRITATDISFYPQIVSSEIDSFDVNIIVTNIGMAITDTFIVKLIRTTPNFTDSVEYFKAGCFYKDTISITLPVDPVNGIGLNSFCVYLDSEYSIAELSELNNDVCVNQNIISGDLIPIYPYEYAIYPNSTVKLKASTGNPFITSQTSIFEIDTTDTFDSPLKLSGTFTHQGGVVDWDQVISLQDTTVYYWRVSKVPVSGGSYNWKESSFIHIDSLVGWSQAHHFQFKKDTYKYIDFNRPTRDFSFVNYPRQLHCQNVGSANSGNYFDVFYEIDYDIRDRSGCCPYGAINVVVIDPISLESWKSDHYDYEQANYPNCEYCNGTNFPPAKYYTFYSDTTYIDSYRHGQYLNYLVTFLQSIPNGYYILMYSFINGNISKWPPELEQEFINLNPSTDVPYTTTNYPFIFFAQKGNPTFHKEEIGTTATSIIDLYVDLPTDYLQGNITSTIVGPTNYWETLHWRHESNEIVTKDTTSLEIIGLKNLSSSGDSLMTFDANTLDDYDLYNDINASVYPYLKLNLYTQDDSTKTPTQLKKWQLTYEGVPETAINPPKGFSFYKDTVLEGEDVVFSIATENISDYDMDSLLVTFWHQDKNNNLHNVKTKRLRPHPSGDVIIDTVRLNTTGYPGLNSIWVEFNPTNTTTGNYDQLEQYHFNNIAQVFFYVESDKTNPILDVTFDGIHILDGDIVSAQPEILIQLKDENKFLALNDQSLFRVYLKGPDDDDEILIPFDAVDSEGNTILHWTPAQLPDNSCQILLTPGKLKDGTYLLRVGATDKSNNESGDIDYYINFEVINKPSITNVFNYPNPFSTSTRFVFELTGSEVPTDFQILIFTITGKLVKVIDLTELGNIHIGRNITDYAWNGRDMYDDQLANGLYFYKITTKLNGEDIEKRDTQTDQYFKHNIGKMYLMR